MKKFITILMKNVVLFVTSLVKDLKMHLEEYYAAIVILKFLVKDQRDKENEVIEMNNFNRAIIKQYDKDNNVIMENEFNYFDIGFSSRPVGRVNR